MNFGPPGPGIAGRFRTIIDGLCHALRWYSARERSAIPLVHIIFTSLRRRAKRFAALVARIEAGLAPPPGGTARSGGEMFKRARPAPELTPPGGRAWLLRMLEHHGAQWVDPLRDLMAEPEMAALIAADPRVARVLRPLWLMLHPQPLPALLHLPPRPPGPPRPRVVRACRPPPPPAPVPPAVPRVPYIIGFGPAPPLSA